VSMRCIWDGGRKPVMRKIICEGDCCGFRSDRWSSTEMEPSEIGIGLWRPRCAANVRDGEMGKSDYGFWVGRAG